MILFWEKTLVHRQPVVERLLEENGYLSRHGTPHGFSPGHRNRPFITLSFAQSLDGSIATKRGAQEHLSSQSTLTLTHALRSVHSAILVGVGTILSDRPRLTTRFWEGADPVPVILDHTLKTPVDAPLFDRQSEGPIFVYGGVELDDEVLARRQLLEQRGGRFLECNPTDIISVVSQLYGLGITSVMVEGGGRVIASFLRHRMVDRVVLTMVPRFLGGYGYQPDGPAYAGRIEYPRYYDFDGDYVVTGGLRWE